LLLLLLLHNGTKKQNNTSNNATGKIWPKNKTTWSEKSKSCP
jgi:hypothetical protein